MHSDYGVFMDHSQVSKSQFKARALEFFRQVEASGEPLIVTDNGRPAVEVRRYRGDNRTPLETLRGSVVAFDDPTDPVAEDDWAALH